MQARQIMTDAQFPKHPPEPAGPDHEDYEEQHAAADRAVREPSNVDVFASRTKEPWVCNYSSPVCCR